MSLTDDVITELERTLSRMCDYREADLSRGYQFPEHAAAYRASMDLTRALAKWRKHESYAMDAGGNHRPK